MHLALFSPSWPRGRSANGIVTYVNELKKMMESEGIQVTILSPGRIYHHDQTLTTFNFYPNFIINTILEFFRNERLKNYFIGKCLTVAIRDHCKNIDIFEMEESFGWIRQVQEQLKIPVILRLHGPEFLGQVDTQAGKKKKASEERSHSEGRAINEAQYISAPSNQILFASIHEFDANPRLSRSYPNPMDCSQSNGWRFSDCNKHQILHVGRFDRRKGADVLIEAFCRIAPEFPLAKLIIVGPDHGIQDKEGTYLNFREYLDRYVNEEFHSRIEFLGQMLGEDIGRLRQESHICIVPSRFEVLPYSSLEALALGMPLLVADGFADNALVVDGKTGWMATNGCPKSFADKIREAFEIDDAIEAIGKAGRDYFMNNYAASAIKADILGFYEDVLADFKKR